MVLVSVTLSVCAFWKKVSYKKFQDAAFLQVKSLIVSGSVPLRISRFMLIRDSVLSYSCPIELRRQFLNLRNLEKDRSPVQLETMRHKHMRRAISVFGKAEYNKQMHCNSIHFPLLWSRLASCLSKMALKRAEYYTSSSTSAASTSGLGNLFTTTVRMNRALSLAGRKIEWFYSNILPLSNFVWRRVTALNLPSKYQLIMELRFDTTLYSNFDNENSDADQVPHPCSTSSE